MAKGGRRQGSGRPKGAKDSRPRSKKNKLPTAKRDPKDNLPSKATYLRMEKYLTAENRKLYKDLMSKFDSPSECLKAIRDDLVARYNLGRIGEMEEISFKRKVAKDELKELENNGTVNGKKIKDGDKPITIKRLKKQAKAYPELSSKLTSLAGEIRQINELIDRIESGRPDRVINLFNILSGKQDTGKTKELRDKVFDIEKDEEIEDGKITEENDNE